jgi:acetoacetyl-CoA synthetase
MGTILWQPDRAANPTPQLSTFIEFVSKRHGLKLETYADLHAWSVTEVASFWEATSDFLEIDYASPHTEVVSTLDMIPGVRWFEGATLNFAQNLLRYQDDRCAILFADETGARRTYTYAELTDAVAKVSASLKDLGIGAGDVVAGFMPNVPETVIAMLATATLGAVWTSTSPDFGAKSVLDRFQQCKPKVLFIADGYPYNGKWHSLSEKNAAILEGLDSVDHAIGVPYSGDGFGEMPKRVVSIDSMLSGEPSEPHFVAMPFMAPLYILYSSGTTGAPKCIIHGAGGTLLQHRKEHAFHVDLRRDDVLFYYTTCGWMMWNWLASGLATGSAIVLYEGSPFQPGPLALWELADELGVTVFGTSARYLTECNRQGLRPKDSHSLASIRSILSTGSTLPDSEFEYVYESIKKDLQLSSIAGGTDLISCFALGNPLLPVRCGELQCKGLGMAVAAFDENSQAVVGQQGELVCTKPFVSMPVAFANDPDGEKYRKAYFADFDGCWRHGDFVEETPSGGLRFQGRSDATLNPGGVRIGTAEIYSVLDGMAEIEDSLTVGREEDGVEEVVLFVKLAASQSYSKELEKAIRTTIRKGCSPRHVPGKIREVREIPYTHNGKKVELAVKNILHGRPVTNEAVLANPKCLEDFRAAAKDWQK